MDTVSVQRIRSNLAQIFSRVDADFNGGLKTDTADSSESQENCLPTSLSVLPIFPVLKDTGDKKKEILRLLNERDLKPFIKAFDRVQAIACGGVELSEQIAACLEFMHKSSQILQQVLKDPLIQDALPLPHHLHRKAIQMIEDCMWMIKHKGWQPIGYEVDWRELIPKLQQEVSSLLTSTKQSEKHFREIEDLKLKLDMILKIYPTLKS